MNNWKTTVAGLAAGLFAYLHASGVSVGHVGATDFIGLAGSVSQIVLGFLAKDAVAKSATSNQKGFARIPVMVGAALLALALLCAPAFAGVSKFTAKRIVAPAAKASYHGAKKAGAVAKKVLF